MKTRIRRGLLFVLVAVQISMLCAQSISTLHPQLKKKIDPMLQQAIVQKEQLPARPLRSITSIESYTAGTRLSTAAGDVVGVLIQSTDDAQIRQYVQSIGGVIGSRHGNIYTALVPVQSVTQVAQQATVNYIEASHRLYPSLDLSRPKTGADVLQVFPDPTKRLTGKGVIIGFTDTGINTDHPNFKLPDGRTRILYVWDQYATSGGTPPAGFSYGIEKDSSDINAHTWSMSDYPIYHGTHVAGIAAGNGLPSLQYIGMAPEADIITVSNRANDLFNHGLTTVGTLDGYDYIRAKANALHKRFVINTSEGTNLGPHDGTTLFEQALNADVAAGSINCISSGNEADKSLHASAIVKTSSPQVIQCQLNYQGDYIPMDIWYKSNDRMVLQIKESTDPGYVSLFPPVDSTITYSLNSVDLTVTTKIGSTLNGDNEIYITFYQRTASCNLDLQFSADLGNTLPGGGRVDLWWERNYIVSFTSNVDRSITLGMPACADSAITVASYNNRSGGGYGLVDDISPFSSCGPRRDGVIKPDIAALGGQVISSIDSCGYANYSGTSMSSPHVTGAVALLLQQDPTLTSYQIKQKLFASATVDGFTGTVPNSTWGYGKLNVFKAAGYHELPIISISKDTVRYPYAVVNIKTEDSVIVKNLGNADLTVSISVSNPIFSVDKTSFVVPSRSQEKLTISVMPTSVGSFSGSVTISCNDTIHPTLIITAVGHTDYSPVVGIAPDSLSVTIPPGDSTTRTLTIGNKGSGVLPWIANYDSFTAPIYDFYDGFESGNYNGWNNDDTTGIREVTNSTSAEGVYSFHYHSADSITGVLRHGISKGFAANYHPEYIGFYVRVGSIRGSNGYFELEGNVSGTWPILFVCMSGKFWVNADAGGDYTYSCNANQWYRIEFRNIDWVNKKFDYYVDNQLIKANIPIRFASSVNQFARLYLYNFGVADAWWDGIGTAMQSNYLTCTPSSGIIKPDSIQTVTVKFNAKGLLPGKYQSNISITSNDTANGVKLVPAALMVEGGPAIVAAPASISITISPGDSASSTLIIENTGSDALHWNASCDTSTSVYDFFDGFENGNYNGWHNDDTTGIKEVTNSTAAEGRYSFHNQNTVPGLKHGISRDFAANYRPECVGFYVRVGSTSSSSGYFRLEADTNNPNSDLINFLCSWGTLAINNYTPSSYNANQWYHVEFKNIDWVTKNFDCYVNNQLVKTGIPFYNTALANQFARLYLYSYDISDAWWDGIGMGNNWLTIASLSGIITPSSIQSVTLKFNAKGLKQGEYRTNISIASNDPVNSVKIIPVHLTVMNATGIPNSGFENWTNRGNCKEPTEWYSSNIFDTTANYFPVTRSTDHYPISVGSYSVRIANDTALWNTGIRNQKYLGCGAVLTCKPDSTERPLFAISGHPKSLRGYYKFLPQNGDTANIIINLYLNGVRVSEGLFINSSTVSDWTPFNVPLPSYTNADSANITITSFNSIQSGPHGNSVLYVDNLSFDSLITTSVSKNQSSGIISKYELYQNYPNPFNPSTIISFSIPSKSFVSLKVYDLLGREVATIVSEEISAGSYSKQWNASSLSSGVYFYRLQAGSYSATKKLVLLK